MHPTDDDLILHFYGETRRDDAARIDAHLQACATCRDAWAELRATLDLVDRAPCPEPDPGFERALWARVQPHLPARGGRWTWARLVPIGAAAAAAAVVFAAVLVERSRGTVRSETPAVEHAQPVPATTEAAARQLRERVLLTALDDHVEEAQLLLVELMNAPESADGDVGFARQTASDLVASGRLYRETAIENGNLRLAAMLDDLEPVLVDVARSPGQMNAADLEAIRTRITDGSLLFKMRAAANEIRERQRETVAASTE